jgi:CubicO group peptidase (beta-lactamase class C family)
LITIGRVSNGRPVDFNISWGDAMCSLPRIRRTVPTILVFLFTLPWPAARGDDARPLTSVRAAMQTFVDRGDIAGAVTVVGRHDAVLSFEAVGQADVGAHQLMTNDTVFRIASMTKPVTAIGIMMLVDEGKLSVDDPVEKHLPEFRGQMLVAGRDPAAGTVTLKKPSRPITVRDLLTHTSGLPNWPAGLADLYTKRNRSLAEGILAMSQRPLDFEPGSKWAYCNTGIDTLGRIIEVVSGRPYEEFLSDRVFSPLSMTDTTFYPSAGQLARLAVNYSKKDGRLVPGRNPIIDLPAKGGRYPVPAGGLFSTGGDLAKLYQMMLSRGTRGNVRLLSEKSVAEMTRLQTGDLKTGFVDGMGWGLGWGVVREPKGVTAPLSPGSYGHGGAFGTQAWLDPAKDLFMVLLIQRTDIGNSDGSAIRGEFQKLAAAGAKTGN